MINAIIRVIVHVRVCYEEVESAREGTLRVRPLPSYLSGHLSEMFGISPHAMDKNLSTRNRLQGDRVEGFYGTPTSK